MPKRELSEWYEKYGLPRLRQYHEIVDAAKDVPCADCKGRFPPCCMDFDHVRGKKVFTIADKKPRTVKALLSELAKCDVVCANCHRIRTKTRLALDVSVQIRQFAQNCPSLPFAE